MAVFVCCADESADENPKGNFVYSGFGAPVTDWDGPFLAAWDEWVLAGPPRIPYLHMTDIRSKDWRAEYGLTVDDAERRLNGAAQVIRGMGSLIPITFCLNETVYNRLIKPLPFRPTPYRVEPLAPDYVCFLWFAFSQLKWIHEAYPDVDRVDFWVEENQKITRYIGDFHKRLPANLRYINHPELAALVGGFSPVPKDRIPAQAADMLGWHNRNLKRGRLDAAGQRRLWEMTEGGFGTFGKWRYGLHLMEMEEEILERFAESLQRRATEEEANALSSFDETV